MIWKRALPKPRTITISTEIRFEPGSPFLEGESTKHPEYFKLVSNAVPIPCGVFQTSRESRAIALKVYSPAFAERLGKPVYFDWLYDILCFRTPWSMFHFCAISQRLLSPYNKPIPASVPEWQSKIRHLARCHNTLLENTCLKLLTTFPNLETLTREETLEVPQGWSREKVLRHNDDDKRRLYGLWKKDLGIDDESKLLQIIFLS